MRSACLGAKCSARGARERRSTEPGESPIVTGVNHYIPGMPPGSRPLARALATVLLIGPTLAACAPGGPDGPPREAPWGTTATATVSPAASPSSTPASASPTTPVANPTLGPLPDGVAPARPAALDQPPTLEGAKAVATYFLLLYPYAYQTGDLSAWNALAHPDCNFCASVRTHVSEATSVGRHTVGGAFTGSSQSSG